VFGGNSERGGESHPSIIIWEHERLYCPVRGCFPERAGHDPPFPAGAQGEGVSGSQTAGKRVQFRKEEVIACAQTAAANCGFEIYEIVVQFRKNSHKIDVRIDNGSLVSHDDCSRYTRELSSLIDSTLQIESYILEVSSPGLKRKIRNYDEYRRFTGAPVKVVLLDGGAIKGILESVGTSSFTVLEDGKQKSLSFESVKSANLDY